MATLTSILLLPILYCAFVFLIRVSDTRSRTPRYNQFECGPQPPPPYIPQYPSSHPWDEPHVGHATRTGYPPVTTLKGNYGCGRPGHPLTLCWSWCTTKRSDKAIGWCYTKNSKKDEPVYCPKYDFHYTTMTGKGEVDGSGRCHENFACYTDCQVNINPVLQTDAETDSNPDPQLEPDIYLPQ